MRTVPLFVRVMFLLNIAGFIWFSHMGAVRKQADPEEEERSFAEQAQYWRAIHAERVPKLETVFTCFS